MNWNGPWGSLLLGVLGNVVVMLAVWLYRRGAGWWPARRLRAQAKQAAEAEAERRHFHLLMERPRAMSAWLGIQAVRIVATSTLFLIRIAWSAIQSGTCRAAAELRRSRGGDPDGFASGAGRHAPW